MPYRWHNPFEYLIKGELPMYVYIPVDAEGKQGKPQGFSATHNPNIQVGQHIQPKRRLLEVTAVVHETHRTVLYVKDANLESVLGK